MRKEDDGVVSRTQEYVMAGQWLQLRGRHCQDDISVLVWDRNKFYVNENDILCRNQMIYRQLHEEMGHLRDDWTPSKILDHFHWTHVQKVVDHYVTKVCSCLESSK